MQSLKLLAVGLLGLGLFGPVRAKAADPPGAKAGPRTVAVLEFVDKGPSVELAVLRTALAEMLSSDLAQCKQVQLVERVRVDEFLRESNLQKGFVDGASAERAGQALAARYLVTGTFRGQDKSVSVEATLFEVGKSEPLAKWSLSRPATELLSLERDLTGKVLASLGIEKPVRPGPPPVTIGPSRIIAVLALRNLSTSRRLDPMQTGFAEILQAHLGAMKDVRLVERQQLFEVLKEQKLSLSGLVDPATAVRVGRLLGAERLVYGSFVEVGDKLRFDMRVADTRKATIVRAESCEGPTAQFAAQLEKLAVRLAEDLAVAPPKNAGELLKAATPTRRLEAALHMAEAELAFYRGQFDEAAKACERALLVEPNRPAVMLRRIRARVNQREYGAAIEAGQQALASGALVKKSAVRQDVYESLAYAYYAAQKFDEAAKVTKQMEAEFPVPRITESRLLLMTASFYTGRRDDIIDELDRATQGARLRGDQRALFETVNVAMAYYVAEDLLTMASPGHEKNRADPVYRAMVTRRSRDSARRVLRLFELVLEVAPRHMDVWGPFVEQQIFGPLRLSYMGDHPWTDPYLTKEEKLQYIDRVLKTFPNNKVVAQEAAARLASIHGTKQAPDAVLASLRRKLKMVPSPRSEKVPDLWGTWSWGPGRALDQLIWARYKIADVQAGLPESKETAGKELTLLVSQFGVAHSAGVSIAGKLKELGLELRLPRKAALIWGGGSRAQVVWRDVLAPRGLTVHGVAQYRTAGEHLAPYPLVVLVRQGRVALMPSEVLALRGYVATGGSLLVVVTPGFEPAAPSIHNALLSLFGVTAESEMVVRAESTSLAEHPITRGIDKAMAKTAVNLKVPKGAAIVRSGDRVVLAALSYRHGRVVVASFGQWLLPDAKTPPDAVPIDVQHWTQSLLRDRLPLESGEGLQRKLLDNVVAWLLEPHREGGPLSARREPFVAAQMAVLKTRFGLASRDSMFAALERLIAEAPAGDWKEEALWVAGEAMFGARYHPAGKGDTPRQTWRFRKEEPFLPIADYHQRLIDQFPDSPLRPYAQWRLGEVKYCLMNCYRIPVSDWATVAKQYEQVQADEGSHPWAWAKIGAGMFLYHSRQYTKAIECYDKILNAMEPGPEKAIAMLNLARCHQAAGNKKEAIRYYRMAKSCPNVYFANTQVGPFNGWSAMSKHGLFTSMGVNQQAMIELRRMWVFW